MVVRVFEDGSGDYEDLLEVVKSIYFHSQGLFKLKRNPGVIAWIFCIVKIIYDPSLHKQIIQRNLTLNIVTLFVRGEPACGGEG